MSFESAPVLIQTLADEFHRSKTSLQDFAKLTGISKDRLELVCKGGWEVLTIMEIVSIITALGIDPGAPGSSAVE